MINAKPGYKFFFKKTKQNSVLLLNNSKKKKKATGPGVRWGTSLRNATAWFTGNPRGDSSHCFFFFFLPHISRMKIGAKSWL